MSALVLQRASARACAYGCMQIAQLEAMADEAVALESRAEAAENERDDALERARVYTPRPAPVFASADPPLNAAAAEKLAEALEEFRQACHAQLTCSELLPLVLKHLQPPAWFYWECVHAVKRHRSSKYHSQRMLWLHSRSDAKLGCAGHGLPRRLQPWWLVSQRVRSRPWQHPRLHSAA